jgi:hypothetical protein
MVRKGNFIKLTRANVLVEHPTSGRLFKASIGSLMSLRVIDLSEILGKKKQLLRTSKMVKISSKKKGE